VPASIWRYGSILTIFIVYPHALSSLPIDAAVIHLPKPEITPPVTKISFMVFFRKLKEDEKIPKRFSIVFFIPQSGIGIVLKFLCEKKD
jgi:hypothetical protein